MIVPVPVRVECHCGHTGEEYPTAVCMEDRRREVEEIQDRWYEGSVDPTTPEAVYFKVRTAGGTVLILRHDLQGRAWYMMCEL